MKGKITIKKTNIYVRFATVSNIYLIFYGYAKGAKSINPELTLKDLAVQFINEVPDNIDLDHMDFINGYNRVNKMMIELKQSK